ncbi:EF-hand domain-containing protein [Methylobacillus gramineus]|uniref:EF-hand domain-containing protein n=1 Tax=Methylobacillus gramineus TaxID=755169 RepID=UPI001CFFE2A1|nr:EF-hand domain-containing protein [Methylobacillus gramineus]MCB5185036.1 EF-hand domain-containing protein [Methylobacillus gramineus]
MLIVTDLIAHQKHVLLIALALMGCAGLAIAAGPRDKTAELLAENELQEIPGPQIHQTLDGKISLEDRLRLRRDLDEYSRSVDAAHAQIEDRRRVMRQRILERFQEADRDNNGVISREEATEFLPQVARHFMQFDLNGDGMITMNELETVQARIAERQHMAIEKKEMQDISEQAKAKSKEAAVVPAKRSL